MSEQEPKYEFRDGRIFNIASGEAIPDDEPIMIFRARDIHTRSMIRFYLGQLNDVDHVRAVAVRLADFERFADQHPERMKEPDTAPGDGRV